MTVVKETGIDERPSKEAELPQKLSWFPGKWGWGLSQSSADLESKRNQEIFRKSMQQFSLYEDKPTSVDKSVQVGVDAQPETVSRVEMLSSERVGDDDHPDQELSSTSLQSSDTNLSNQTVSSVDKPTDLETGMMGDGSMSVETEDQGVRTPKPIVISISPESTDEYTMEEALPLITPTPDNQDLQRSGLDGGKNDQTEQG